MPRVGGRRRGKPGTAYANRTDLNKPVPVAAATGQAYGEAGAQMAAQRVVPVAPSPSAGGVPVVPPPPPAGPAPGSFGPLTRPTERPGEPLTSGIASGAGPGPEALGMGRDATVDELRALYAAYPNEDLRELLEDADMGLF